jgi:hypothetical protein
MSGTFHASRCARFESLEQRQLLAGDVLVNVVEGRLIIEGDELSNSVAIAAGAEAGSFVVTGLESTTVHEEGETPTSQVVVTGVDRGAQIDLGEGDDEIAMAALSLRGNASIDTGEGEDHVMIGPQDAAVAAGLSQNGVASDMSVRVGGTLRISTGDDDDQIDVDDASIRGKLKVYAGLGDDVVSLGGAAAMGLATGSSEAVGRGGLGRFFGGGFFNGNSVDIDARLHVKRGLHVDLGDGDDEFSLNQAHVRSFVSALGGLGDDEMRVNLTKAHGISMHGQDGEDLVSLEQAFAGFAGVHTGEGGDDVSIVDSAFFVLGVRLGDGDDMLATGNIRARFGLMHGGDGEDTHTILEASDIGHKVIKSFELPPELSNPNDVARSRNVLSLAR